MKIIKDFIIIIFAWFFIIYLAVSFVNMEWWDILKADESSRFFLLLFVFLIGGAFCGLWAGGKQDIIQFINKKN